MQSRTGNEIRLVNHNSRWKPLSFTIKSIDDYFILYNTNILSLYPCLYIFLSFLTNLNMPVWDYVITTIPLYLFLRLLFGNSLSSPPSIQFLLFPDSVPNIAQALHSSSNTAGINAVYLKNVMLEQWTRPWLMIGARECEQSEQIYFGTLVCTGSGGRINITQPLFRGWWRLRHFTFLKYQILKLRADSILSKKWLTAIVYWLNAKNKSNTVREHLLPATWIFRSQQQLRYSVYNSRTFVSRMPSKEIIYSLYHGWRDISNAVHPGTHDCITMEGETHTR